MPRGFLVKRTKKPGAVSYRVREECVPAQGFLTTVHASGMPCYIDRKHIRTATLHTDCNQVWSIQSRVSLGGMPEAQCPPTLSPNRPVSAAYPQQNTSAEYLDRKLNSSSPVQAESFPEQNFAISGTGVAFPPSLAEMTTKLGNACKEPESTAVKRPAPTNAKTKQTHAKKHKSSSSANGDKKLNYRDEVTTSPVLGLKIKEMPEEDAKPRSNSPLGEFICQLCKERYADPLTLAQHRCSRIVRVDYRCTECDKVFSCPANLASHRRWHKPKTQPEGSSADSEEMESNMTSVGLDQTIKIRDGRTPSPQVSDSGSEEDLAFSCPLCCKKFRRQAYLRKHLALHNRQATASESAQPIEEKVKSNQQQNCSGDLRSLYLGKDAQGTGSAASEVYPCRFCGENFLSSPGLTRHINKCHPAETRHVILLSQTG